MSLALGAGGHGSAAGTQDATRSQRAERTDVAPGEMGHVKTSDPLERATLVDGCGAHIYAPAGATP